MGSPITFGSKKFGAFGSGKLPLPEVKNQNFVNYAVYSGSGATGAVTTLSQTVVQIAPLPLSIRVISVEANAWVSSVGNTIVTFENLRLTLFNSSLTWNFQPLPGSTGGSAALIVNGNPQNKVLRMDFEKGLVNGYAGSNLNVELTFMKSVAFAGTDTYTFSIQIGWQPL